MRPILLPLIATAGLLLGACDDGVSEPDSGVPPADTGTDMMDSGGDDSGTPPPDSGMMMGMSCGPTTGDCDVSDPASCGTGMACVLQGGGGEPWTTVCIQEGVIAEGMACDPTMQAQCQQGFQCDSTSRICARVCCSGVDCNPGDDCIALSMAGPMGMEAGFCRTPVDCDPVDGTAGCSDGTGCYPTSSGSFSCFSAGDIAIGEMCSNLNDCAPGSACITGDPSVCRQFCLLSEPVCPSGFACGGLSGVDRYGVCVPME